MERLKKLCEKKILVSINTENAATILQAANLHSAMGLRQSCMDDLERALRLQQEALADSSSSSRSSSNAIKKLLQRVRGTLSGKKTVRQGGEGGEDG